jgi:hypothetical protein
MNTLTELGRREICKMIGIKNPKSIFVKNENAFVDRMTLLNVMYNTQYIIDVYKEEMSQYNSEEEYIKFLNEQEEQIGSEIVNKLLVVETLGVLFGDEEYQDSLLNTQEYSVLKRAEDPCILRIYFEAPMYESFKYIMSEIYDCESDFHEFVYNLTGSKFLALYNDIQTEWLDDEYSVELLKSQMNIISSLMLTIVCPKSLNTINLRKMGEAELQFDSTERKSIESIDRLYQLLSNNDRYDFDKAIIELYKFEKLAENEDIIIKLSALADKDLGVYNISNYDQYTLIRYLRHINGEPISKYDNYLDMNGSEIKVMHGKKIKWF